MLFENKTILYVLKFIGIFLLLYYGTKALIGLAVPGGLYSSFIHNYVDIAGWLRSSLLHASGFVLLLLGYKTLIENIYTLRMIGGNSVHLVFSCLGIGVMSFWVALIAANKGSFKRKTFWILLGVFLIWCINILRISLLLLAVNNKWGMPFNMDNHTFFNVLAYSCIFLMIYIFDKSEKKKALPVP